MDAHQNPFLALRGAPVARLFGRDLQWQALDTFLHQLRDGRGASLVVSGLRGSGKTTLLLAAARQAGALGLVPIVVGGPAFVLSLNIGLRSALLLAGDDLPAGRQMSPAMEFSTLLLTLARRCTGVLIGIDDAHRLTGGELNVLLDALRSVRLQHGHVGLLVTALPGATRPVHREQLLGADWPPLDLPALGAAASAELLVGTALPRGLKFETSALASLVTAGRGHPLTLQQLGASAWLLTDTTPVRLATAQRALLHAQLQLESSFYAWRQQRLAPQERHYLHALAALGEGAHRSGEIAAQLQRQVTALAPTRSALIAKELLYSPRYGETAFTAPGYSGYLHHS